MRRRCSLAALLPTILMLLVALPALMPSQAGAQTDSGNRPFVGVWKLNPEKSKLPASPAGFAVYRQYEDHGDGWMYHTVITVTPRHTDFLFTAARYDSRQYDVYNGRNLGAFIRSGQKTPRTVEFTRVNAHEFRWTDRLNGKVVAGGVCTVSADGNTLTITNQPPGQTTVRQQVFDRVSAGSSATPAQTPSPSSSSQQTAPSAATPAPQGPPKVCLDAGTTDHFTREFADRLRETIAASGTLSLAGPTDTCDLQLHVPGNLLRFQTAGSVMVSTVVIVTSPSNQYLTASITACPASDLTPCAVRAVAVAKLAVLVRPHGAT